MLLSDIISINKKLYTYWDDETVSLDHPIHSVLNRYREAHTDYEIGLIDKNEVRTFLKANFPFLCDLFDKFTIYGVRSDLSRLVHLYIHGGFYCDSHISYNDKAENVELCESTTDRTYKSYMMSKKCSCHENEVCFQYSVGGDDLYLECLKIATRKFKAIIDNGTYKAGQYAHDIHLACSNGLFSYVDLNGNLVNPNINSNYLFNYFGHIKPLGGKSRPVLPYSSMIMTPNNTRANNKHWSDLAEEIDLIYFK